MPTEKHLSTGAGTRKVTSLMAHHAHLSMNNAHSAHVLAAQADELIGELWTKADAKDTQAITDRVRRAAESVANLKLHAEAAMNDNAALLAVVVDVAQRAGVNLAKPESNGEKGE